jgi:hypothetical protein
MGVRNKDTSWTVPSGTISYEAASLCVLMDIRDELKQLNALLSCSNFTLLPRVLKQIRANTTSIKNELKKAK